MRSAILLLIGFQSQMIFAQSQMVLNNDVNMVMSNGVYLVVDNNNPNAITTAGTGGNILSELESNIVSWHINSASGSYVIPFTTTSGIKIPLTMQITGSGAGSGIIDFSTYGGATWNNDTYRPTGVTNMTNMGTTNNSAEVIDRFWIIDAHGYTTKPSGNLQFNYNDAEHLAIGNTINEADLKAERYEESSDNWEVYPVGGVINTTSNYVTGVPFNSSDLVRTWTLIDQTTHLLPLVLTELSIQCTINGSELHWETASEVATDIFIISGSIDGIHFSEIGSIDAAGTSNETHDYIYTSDVSSFSYLKLTLLNEDGTTNELGVRYNTCNDVVDPVFQAFTPSPHTIQVNTTAMVPGDYVVSIYTLSGQCITQSAVSLNEDPASMQYYDQQLSEGMYLVHLRSQSDPRMQWTEKIILLH